MAVRQSVVALASVLLLLSDSPVLAAEDIPPPDEIRFIDMNDATSGCIGDSTTPLCAVETWIACDVRGDIKTCLGAGLPPARNRMAFPGRDRVEYGVMKAAQSPELELSSGPAQTVEIKLIESNNRFSDGWYLDNEFVIRDPYVLTRYRVESWGVKWRVTERAECFGKKLDRCRAGK